MPRLRKSQVEYAAVSRLLRGYGANGASIATALGCAPATARKKLADPKRFTLGDLDCLSRKYGIPFEEVRANITK